MIADEELQAMLEARAARASAQGLTEAAGIMARSTPQLQKLALLTGIGSRSGLRKRYAAAVVIVAALAIGAAALSRQPGVPPSAGGAPPRLSGAPSVPVASAAEAGALRGPAPSCASGSWVPSIIPCTAALAVGDQAGARVDRVRIWQTTLDAVHASLHPLAQTVEPSNGTTVWLAIFDGSWRCCPNAVDQQGSPIPQVTESRWLVVVDATAVGSGFVYLQDWTGKPVPAQLPSAGSTPSTAAPGASPLAIAGGCGTTTVYAGPGPAAASTTGLNELPWAASTPQTAGFAAYLFASLPLTSGGARPDGATNKILWMSDTPADGGLLIAAHPLGASSPVVRFNEPGVLSFPSIIDLPYPGCWQLDLSAGTTHGSIDLLVSGVAGLAGASAAPSTSCAVTIPGAPFVPPSTYPDVPPPEYHAVWYGTADLWTMLSPTGELWSGLPRDASGLSQKTFWWSQAFVLAQENQPAISITGQRLDVVGPTFSAGPPGTNAGADFGEAMLMGISVPTSGCWSITATYRGTALEYVVWVADH